ncbi:MAG: hypothetical protein NUV49_02560 [Patescibacteria group bacterium]|nr:hypothetical protein [Patescibacteria group bacterium]
MNRSATASLHSATPKKNVPCFSDMVVVKFFLKKERTFFFGVLPSRSRAGGGTMRTKFWQNYFLGKGFAKTSAHLFLNSEVANGKGGVWGGIFHLLLFLFWRNSGRTENRKNKFNIVSIISLLVFVRDYGVHPRHSPRTFPLGLLAPRCLGLAHLLAIARLRAGGSGAMLFGGRKESFPQLRSPPRSGLLEYSVL